MSRLLGIVLLISFKTLVTLEYIVLHCEVCCGRLLGSSGVCAYSECFCYDSHDSFHVPIVLWPPWGDPSVGHLDVLEVGLKLLSVEWWPIV